MSELTLESLSTQYFDVLKEIGNIGAGNATTALATMLQCKVDMKVPQVRMMEFKDVGAMLGGEEQEMAGAYLEVDGDISGSILFLVKRDVAMYLVKKLMGDMATDEFGEMEQSAFKEISNIVTGSYLNALSSLTNMNIYPTIPDMAIDMAGAIISVPVILFGQVGDRVMLIETDLFEGTYHVKSNFFLIPDEDSFEILLKSLGVF